MMTIENLFILLGLLFWIIAFGCTILSIKTVKDMQKAAKYSDEAHISTMKKKEKKLHYVLIISMILTLVFVTLAYASLYRL